MIAIPIINVAIGTLFLWIVLSLATIQIQEWITIRLDKRARDLEDAIHEILANPNLKSQFYDHPVIRGLTAKKRKQPSRIPPWFYRYPIVRGFTQEKRKLPSYISAQQFATVLFDIILTAGTESALIQQGLYRIQEDLAAEDPNPDQRAVIDLLDLLADLARGAAATEAGIAITNITPDLLKQNIHRFSLQYPAYEPVIDAVLKEAIVLKSDVDQILKKQGTAKNSDPAVANLRRGIAALSVISPTLSQMLSTLFLHVEEYAMPSVPALVLARNKIEMWFSDAMDRVTGVFKRYSQSMAMTIGLMIALLMNVDLISITRYLWQASYLQQALVQQVSDFTLTQETSDINPQEAIQGFSDQYASFDVPIGWVLRQSPSASFTDVNCQLFPGVNQTFGIPILSSRCLSPSQSDNQTNLLLKLIGIFFTAFTVRFGAPLWFDILKRITNPRGTGPRPAEKE